MKMFTKAKIPIGLFQSSRRMLGNDKHINQIRFCSSGNFLQYDKDPGPHFINPVVQNLLKSMTRMQFEKVFRKRSVTQNQTDLQFMTVEQFKERVYYYERKAKYLLQMPPVVQTRKDESFVLEKKSDIEGFSDAKLVITDITFGTPDSSRLILIRHPDGTLEHAPEEIRKRCNQVYFPREGRLLTTPKMFEGEHLQAVLDSFNYEFLLDRLVIQFDPYEHLYHEISSKTYQHINTNKRFDDLRSTRHFGPMAFFFAWHRMIDDLLVDNIKRDYLRNGVELILLQCKLHCLPEEESVAKVLDKCPDKASIVDEYCKSMLGSEHDNVQSTIGQIVGKASENFEADETFLKVIETFTKNHAVKKVQLELAIQTFREEAAQKIKLYQGLQKQHGIST